MRGLAVCALCFAALLAMPAVASADPCPPGTEPALEMKAPERVAVGRQGYITVTDGFGDPTGPENARIDMLDEQRQPFFTHVFTEDDLFRIKYEFEDMVLFVRLDAGDLWADIRLAATQNYFQSQPPYGYGTCESVQERRVTPLSAAEEVHPRVTIVESGDLARLRIVHPQGCEVAPVRPLVLRVRHGRESARFTLADSCDDERQGWRRKGRVTGISVRGSRTRRSELRLNLSAASWRDSEQPYKLTVLYDGRLVATRWAEVLAYIIRARRVWEGTDEFWNYCVNEGKRTWSSGGRLYCIRPGSRDRWISLYRKKPR
jgi:hypothetical protein